MAKAEWTWGTEVRVRQAEDSSQASRALRSLNVGSWLVERRGGVINPLTGMWAPGSGGWHFVSSHLTEEAANKAKTRIERGMK